MSYKEVYEELSLLGEGGMGKVYLVRHRRLGVLRAMKVVRKDDATKLPAEVDILKNLDHQRLPRLHDIYEDDQNIQIIQDYVEGISAKEGIERGGKFDEAHVRKWAGQICEALKYLHTRNPPIIHRDIKPGNIMITPEGDIKLIDFGIAKEYKKDANGPSEHLGTMGYAAPEQYTSAPTDARTDIYSLGITLYHMITGKSPYEPPYELRPIREWNRSYSEGMYELGYAYLDAGEYSNARDAVRMEKTGDDMAPEVAILLVLSYAAEGDYAICKTHKGQCNGNWVIGEHQVNAQWGVEPWGVTKTGR